MRVAEDERRRNWGNLSNCHLKFSGQLVKIQWCIDGQRRERQQVAKNKSCCSGVEKRSCRLAAVHSLWRNCGSNSKTEVHKTAANWQSQRHKLCFAVTDSRSIRETPLTEKQVVQLLFWSWQRREIGAWGERCLQREVVCYNVDLAVKERKRVMQNRGWCWCRREKLMMIAWQRSEIIATEQIKAGQEILKLREQVGQSVM